MQAPLTPQQSLAVKIALATLQRWNQHQVEVLLASLSPEETLLLESHLATAGPPVTSRMAAMLAHDWSEFLEQNKATLCDDQLLQRAVSQLPKELLQSK